MKLAWVTDPHLNFISNTEIKVFTKYLNDYEADGVVITGDIAEASTVVPFLGLIAKSVTKPIYFVLGNHDFYHSSIEDVRTDVNDLTRQFKHLHYLTKKEVIALTPNVGIMGHDLWYDCKSGTFMTSSFWLADFEYIQDYIDTNKTKEDIFEISKLITEPGLQHIGGLIGRVGENNCYIATYPKVLEDKSVSSLNVGEHVMAEYSLSGTNGVYAIYRVK